MDPGPPVEWPSFIHHAERFWYGLHTPGVGLKMGAHHGGALIDPDEPRIEVDPSYIDGLVRYARALGPGRDARAVRADHLPVHDDARRAASCSTAAAR